MEISIKGEAKEIAALVLAVQERQEVTVLVKGTSIADTDPDDLVKKYQETVKRLAIG